jgi:hypothetical protein
VYANTVQYTNKGCGELAAFDYDESSADGDNMTLMLVRGNKKNQTLSCTRKQSLRV